MTATAQETALSRNGRRRKAGARTKAGQLKNRKPAKDHGTPEFQRLRTWLAGQGDPNLTSYPLGVLLANNEITEAQHTAGCRYAWLHAVVFGRHSIAAVSYERTEKGRAGGWDDEWLARREAELRDMTRRLMGHPARLRMALANLIVYERMPRWMRPLRPRPSDVREAELFCKGLELLAAEKRCAA